MRAAAEATRNQPMVITVQEVGPSAFILYGLDLEVIQYVFSSRFVNTPLADHILEQELSALDPAKGLKLRIK